jgi:hypothetical protein
LIFLKTLLPVPRFKQGLHAPSVVLELIILRVVNPVKAVRHPSVITTGSDNLFDPVADSSLLKMKRDRDIRVGRIEGQLRGLTLPGNQVTIEDRR